MGEKKWEEDVAAVLNRILEHCKRCEKVEIGQEPYKGDFFRIFLDAYHDGFCGPKYRCGKTNRVEKDTTRPPVTGDKIWRVAVDAGWVKTDSTPEEKRYRQLQRLITWWEAWGYAYEWNPPKRRYRRRTEVDS